MRERISKQIFTATQDHMSVVNGQWSFEEINGAAVPVREALSGETFVLHIGKKRVVPIKIPDPYEFPFSGMPVSDNLAMSWAMWLQSCHPNWVDLALEVFTDKWTFQDNDPRFQELVRALERIKEFRTVK